MNEQTQTVVQQLAVPTSGSAGPGLAESLWLYGVPIARPTEYATIVPFSDGQHVALVVPTVEAAATVPDDNNTGARSVVPVRSTDVSVHQQQGRNEGGADSRSLVEQYGDWDVNTMMRIMACESSGNPLAISPDGRNVGLLQVNLVHGWSTAQLQDPAFNIAAAHDVYLSQGYGAWSCY